jgi:preprotein translocase subunit Sss1
MNDQLKEGAIAVAIGVVLVGGVAWAIFCVYQGYKSSW